MRRIRHVFSGKLESGGLSAKLSDSAVGFLGLCGRGGARARAAVASLSSRRHCRQRYAKLPGVILSLLW